ncbi:MAG: hypothetical protein AB8G86_15065 [Saprospiraceae bacterium]
MSLKFAPDPATADRAKKLATTKSWRTLAGNPTTIWGECKSNGLTYYKVAFQKNNQAFKCNCASRKYPCKHAVALSVLVVEAADAFEVVKEKPDWVTDWLAKGAPIGRETTPEAEQAKAALRQKNFSKRLNQMVAGLDELEHWLLDTLRQGIAALEQQPYSFWKEMAARMYDAKLGAIGKRIKGIPALIGTDDTWPEKVLIELTAFYLLIRGLRKMEELPLNIQQDLLAVAGVSTRKEELFQYGQIVNDTWMILGIIEGVEDNLNYRRTWILGHETKRYGLLLDYAFGNHPYTANYKRGNVFVGNVVFYPSNAPLRVALKDKQILDRSIKRIIGFPNFSTFLEFYAQNLAANPWQLSFPCSIEQVLPILEKGVLYLIDKHQKIIPLFEEETKKWKLLAASGGHLINVFGEWSGDRLLLLSLTINQDYIPL